MAQGNRFTYRLRPSTFMQTRMLVEAVRARGIRRWAIVAPNYEYGQSAAANFKRLMAEAQPGFEVVAEQFPALAASTPARPWAPLRRRGRTASLTSLRPGPEPSSCAKATRGGLFERRTVVSLLTGEPEYMIPLGDETPEGWI